MLNRSLAISLNFSRVLLLSREPAHYVFALYDPLRRDDVANSRSKTPMNPIDPNRISASDRLDEIAEILAAGLMRLDLLQQSTPLSRDGGDSSLDCPGCQSGHAQPATDGERHA